VEQWLDWSAFGFLGLLTLLDGLRRVPAGAFVLRRVLGGRWQVLDLREGYRIVSWWPPLTTSLVLSPVPKTSSLSVDQRFERTRKERAILTVLGAVGLVALVIVVPLGMRRWGGAGFLAALMTVLLLSLLTTGASFHAGSAIGLSRRQRFMFAMPRLNPFASPAAGEALLERSLEGANPFAVARALMTEADFVTWVRPLAYDVNAGVQSDSEVELLHLFERNDLPGILAARPTGVGADSPWCPRCGSEFGTTSTECPACEVPLQL
jgi:hypothetical protein